MSTYNLKQYRSEIRVFKLAWGVCMNTPPCVFGLGKLKLNHNMCVALQVWVSIYLSLVTRNPVFGVSDQLRLKPDSSASDAS